MSSEAPLTQSASKSSAELRTEVEEARARLASTVGELGGAIDETRARLIARGKKVAPIVGAAVGSYVMLKIARRVRGGGGD